MEQNTNSQGPGVRKSWTWTPSSINSVASACGVSGQRVDENRTSITKLVIVRGIRGGEKADDEVLLIANI